MTSPQGGAPTAPPVAWASQQTDDAPTVPGREDNRKRRGRRILLAAAVVAAAVLAFLLASGTGAAGDSQPAAAAPATPITVDVHGACCETSRLRPAQAVAPPRTEGPHPVAAKLPAAARSLA